MGTKVWGSDLRNISEINTLSYTLWGSIDWHISFFFFFDISLSKCFLEFSVNCLYIHESVSQTSLRRFQAFGDIKGILLRAQLSRIESTLPKHAGSYYMVLCDLQNHWEGWRETMLRFRKHFQIHTVELGQGRCCLHHNQKNYYRIRNMSSWLPVPEWYLSLCQESAKGGNYL